MTHDELLAKMAEPAHNLIANDARNVYLLALRAVVELHTPKPSYLFDDDVCNHCSSIDAHTEIIYPCPTIQAIEKALK